jgi:hypothetical protein
LANADAATIRRFQATIFPSTGDGVTGQICGGSTQFVKLTYTSDANSTQPTGSVGYSVAAPVSWGLVGTPEAWGGKRWTATSTNTQITLVAQSAGDRLNAGESVSVVAEISTTATSGTFPIVVLGSQSNDPGSGNQFSGNNLAVSACPARTPNRRLAVDLILP